MASPLRYLPAVGILHASFNASGALDVIAGGWQHMPAVGVLAGVVLAAGGAEIRGRPGDRPALLRVRRGAPPMDTRGTGAQGGTCSPHRPQQRVAGEPRTDQQRAEWREIHR